MAICFFHINLFSYFVIAVIITSTKEVVNRFIHKILAWFSRTLVKSWDIGQERTHWILLQIQTKGWIQDFVFTFCNTAMHFLTFSHRSWWKSPKGGLLAHLAAQLPNIWRLYSTWGISSNPALCCMSSPILYLGDWHSWVCAILCGAIAFKGDVKPLWRYALHWVYSLVFNVPTKVHFHTKHLSYIVVWLSRLSVSARGSGFFWFLQGEYI